MLCGFLITFTAREINVPRMQTQTDLFNIYTYTDSELDLNTPELYALDVCISAHQVSFVVCKNLRVMGLRKLNTRLNLLHQDAMQLITVVRQLEWLSNQYKQIRVFIDDERFTLVPEPLFDADKAADYLHLLHKQIPNEKVMGTRMLQQTAVGVFGVNEYLYQYIQTIFNTSSVYHISTVMVQLASQYNNNDLKNSLLVNINEEHIRILYYHNNEVKFLNTFVVPTDADMVYYILSVAGMQGLPKDKFTAIVMGDLSPSSSTLHLLRKYIPEVITANRLDDIKYPLSFREFADHQNYLNIHSFLCE
jgi:hypothetical protein